MRTAQLRITLLGRFSILHGQQRIEIPKRESLIRVFAFLLLQPHKEISRKSLAFRVWPDVAEEEALANLRRHIYLIRESLPDFGRDWLVVSRTALSWEPDENLWVDAQIFSELVREAQVGNLSGDVGLEQAVEIYRDPLLRDEFEDEFILTERERLQAEYRWALIRLVDLCESRGDLEKGQMFAQKLLELEPWDEEVARRLMVLQYASGRSADALRVYDNLNTRLDRELRIAPMPETTALFRSILNNRLVSPPGFRSSRVSTPFVGREKEIQKVLGAVDALMEGKGGILILTGEAGIGKTRLVREALRLLKEQERLLPRVAYSHCLPDMQDQPYGAWVEILANILPIVLQSQQIEGGEISAMLSALLPLSIELEKLAPTVMPAMRPDADHLQKSLRQSLEIASLTGPLMLIVEDVHWADDATLKSLDEILAGESMPILFLITERPAALRGLGRDKMIRVEWKPQQINLRRLDRETVSIWMDQSGLRIGHSQNAREQVLDDVYEISGGNPLLVVELMRQLDNPSTGLNLSDLPGGLKDLTAARLKIMGTDQRRLVEAAAVLGAKFNHASLQNILDWEKSNFLKVIEEVLHSELIRPLYTSAEYDYTFDHNLNRQLIYEDIPTGRKMDWHNRAAAALLNTEANRPGTKMRAAQHLDMGGMPDQAALQWLQHAREVAALCRYDFSLAANQKVLELVKGDDSAALKMKTQAWIQCAEAEYALGRYEATRDALNQAARLMESIESPELRCDYYLNHAALSYVTDKYLEAYDAARMACECASQVDDVDKQALALNYMALPQLMLGKLQAARDGFRASLDLLELRGMKDTSRYIQTLDYFGTALMFLQEQRAAINIKEDVIARSHRAGLQRVEAGARTVLAQMLVDNGHYRQAILQLDIALAMGIESFSPGLLGKYLTRGMAYWRLGELQSAHADFAMGLGIARRVGTSYGEYLCSGYLYCLSFYSNTPATAEIEEKISDLMSQKETGAALAPPTYIIADFLARVWTIVGDSEQGAKYFAIAERAAEATGVERFIATARLHRLSLCSINASESEVLDAKRELHSIAAQYHETPLGIESIFAVAGIHLRDGDPDAALTLLQPSLKYAEEFEDKELILEAHTLLGWASVLTKEDELAEKEFGYASRLAQECCWLRVLSIERIRNKISVEGISEIVIHNLEQSGLRLKV